MKDRRIRSFYRIAILTLVLAVSAVTYEEPALRAQSTPPNCTGSTAKFRAVWSADGAV